MKKLSGLYLVVVTLAAGNVFAASYSGGSGEPNDPYKIANVADFQQLSGTPSDCNKSFILTADIDLGGLTFTQAPIASDANIGFTGIFDGNNHIISNLTINASAQDYVGLFGYVGSGGKINNLGVEDINITGHNFVGGLAGQNSGVLTFCYAIGSVIGSACIGELVGANEYGSAITCCYASGSVGGMGDYSYAGGLVGANDYRSTLTCCYATSSVSGTGKYSTAGGLVGSNDGMLTCCYATGSASGAVVGGLVGNNSWGRISICYSMGRVDGSSIVGGLVGSNGDDGIVAGSFWNTETSGQTTSAGGTGKTTVQMETLSTFTSAGWDFINETVNGTCNYWQMSAGTSPVLSIFNGYIPPKPAGSGTKEDPYIIVNANDLGTIWYRPAANYRLVNDINVAGIGWSMVVPRFSGVLDGNDFCIKNLVITGEDNLGLFGWIETGGSVKNLGLTNCSVSGSYRVGGLAGENDGTLISCYASGSVSGTGEYSDVGGLVGINYGTIIFCHTTCSLTGCGDSQRSTVGGLVGDNEGTLKSCYAAGSVSGTGLIGGLAGVNDSNVTCCYSSASVNGSCFAGGLVGFNGYCGKLTSCTASGLVTAMVLTSCAGGLVGWNDYGSVTCCYATGSVIGTGGYVGGLVGENDYGSITSCSASGSVNGYYFIGGLVGWNDYGSVTCCYATGSVSGTSEHSSVGGLVGENDGMLICCYATGLVKGTGYTGGLVGFVYNYHVFIDSFWDIQASGQLVGIGNGALPGVIGKTTVEMQTLDTFTSAGWDFVDETVNGPNDIWKMPLAGGYPILSWQVGISVPDLIGMTQADANSAIIAAGLVIGTVTKALNSNVAAGNVISQSPIAGISVEPNTPINVVVSLGQQSDFAILVKKCSITAGKKDNSDKISFSGLTDTTNEDILAASQIVVTVNSSDMVNPCVMTFPVNATVYKKDSYNYTIKGDTLRSSFKLSTKTGTFSFSAKNVDLSGLGCPFTVTIQIGDYSADTVLEEDIVNGPKKLCPYQLMMGVKATLAVDKVAARRGSQPNSDSLKISGRFTTVAEPNLSEPFVIIVGLDYWTYTVPANQFLAKNGVLTCKNAVSNEGPLVTAKLDYVKCTFSIAIKNMFVPELSNVDFGIDCFGNNLIGLETIDLGP